MRYFIDTEFIERPYTIDLISIGIACEDGRSLYAEASDVDWSKANDFVNTEVRPRLLYDGKIAPDAFVPQPQKPGDPEAIRYYGPKSMFVDILVPFITGPDIKFWGYYADYDWVAFCWLFGSTVDLPVGYPMFCRDVKQFAELAGITDRASLPDDPANEHNALADAYWTMEAYAYVNWALDEKRASRVN